MEKKKLTTFVFAALFALALIIPVAPALDKEQQVTAEVIKTDIAYIYRIFGKVDSNIVSVLTDKGFNVELIKETELPDSFEKYSFIFLGDERFREEIPVNNHPAIIASYYNSNEWGITDTDEVSKVGATTPLTVKKGNEIIIVYTKAFIKDTLAVPYYFLDKLNKAPVFHQIATSRNFGDVIGYVPAGEILLNGKEQKENLCFFGIIKTEYWTEQAEELFIECTEFVAGRELP